MRPMAFTLPVPAIPYTSVPKISGAMIDRISRRNTLPTAPSIRCRLQAPMPSATPAAIAMKIQRGQRRSLHRSPHLSFCAQHVEEHLARRPDQVQRVVRASANHVVVLAQRRADLPVDRQERALVGTARRDPDHARLGHHHRAIGQHVRADRRDADAPAPPER